MRYVLFIFGLCSWVNLNAQPNNYKHTTNNMVINRADATFKFQVAALPAKVKAKDKLTYYWYKSDKILETDGGYSGKLLNGDYKEYYPSKNLKTQGTFKNGLKHGEWKSWYDEGKLKEITHSKKGVLHGTYEIFDIEGQPSLESNYKKGRAPWFLYKLPWR